jgi:proteic killer suppression protein
MFQTLPMPLLHKIAGLELSDVRITLAGTITGDLKGFWSVSVSGNWRIIFRFENGKAFDVEMTDYH